MSDSNIIRVQIVDDHALVRDGIRGLLERCDDIRVVVESSTGEEAYTHYFEHHPDVVLLDVAMPGEGGLSALRRILRRDSQACVVMLTMYDDEVIAVKTIEAGERGFMSKGMHSASLVDAVRGVAAGEVYLEDRIAHRMAILKTGSGLQSLSGREFEVFRMLAEGKGVQHIADLLHLSPKTVGTHRTRIMVKLGCENVAELARIAIRKDIITP
ncbi:MAG: DNA-binding response regulator [Zetaproteobacteria bacterium CG_4_8_14_3_um_filter_59_5]|nr:MAG: DNA-binding response regulator [Zetaproteobacteria bacterium CG_4_8_14_3_um_filter_59_5]